MSPETAEGIFQQLKLCEQAISAFKAYLEAKGVASHEELERLRLQAEFHYSAINDYLLNCRHGARGNKH
jgi:hypothetical protein